MTVLTRNRVTLGPCRCQGCNDVLYWAKWPEKYLGNTVFRMAWREEDGTRHVCPNLPARIKLSGQAA